MESHHVRMLLTSRRTVLDKCIDLENEIRGLFEIFGIKLPPKLGHGSFDKTMRAVIEADEKLSHALLPMLDARLVLYETFRVLDNRTCHLAWGDKICERLMTAPGVGYVTALTFKSGVDDPTRFKRSRTVAAHSGLTLGARSPVNSTSTVISPKQAMPKSFLAVLLIRVTPTAEHRPGNTKVAARLGNIAALNCVF